MARESFPFAPLPGSQRSPRGLFIDRWGTLLEEPARGHCRRPDELAFRPGAVDALFRAHRAGWYVYLIGNEDPVARGRQKDEDWKRIQSAILEELEGHGVVVRRFYACLDHPEGQPPHRQDSVYLLPNTGAFYQASHLDGIELRESWVIGDSTLELVAGWRAGLRLVGVQTGRGLADGAFEVEPEVIVPDLPTAVSLLLDAEGALIQ